MADEIDMKRKALFVGVNEYDDPQIRDLKWSLGDAHAFYSVSPVQGFTQ